MEEERWIQVEIPKLFRTTRFVRRFHATAEKKNQTRSSARELAIRRVQKPVRSDPYFDTKQLATLPRKLVSRLNVPRCSSIGHGKFGRSSTPFKCASYAGRFEVSPTSACLRTRHSTPERASERASERSGDATFTVKVRRHHNDLLLSKSILSSRLDHLSA